MNEDYTPPDPVELEAAREHARIRAAKARIAELKARLAAKKEHTDG